MTATTPIHAILACLLALASRTAYAQSAGNDNSQPKRANMTIIIAIAVSVSGALSLLGVLLACRKRISKFFKGSAATPAARPAMTQTAGPSVTTAARTGANARRPRRERQTSTVTVPEYAEQAADEEMVLDKAIPFVVQVEDTNEPDHSQFEGNYSRPSFNSSRAHLLDIEPAPELRVERYDAMSSVASLSLNSSGHDDTQLLPLHRHMASDSTVSLDTTLENVSLDETSLGSRRASSVSFFASPAYTTRSRSRSIDIMRTASNDDSAPTAERAGTPQSTTGLLAPSAASTSGRRTSTLRTLFLRPSAQQTSSVSPAQAALDAARSEALRNRQISAPLADTLVQTSYQLPKAGLNTVQAAWLGSRDAIKRMTTYLDTTPPSFVPATEEVQEQDATAAEASVAEDTASSAGSELPRSVSVRSARLSAAHRSSTMDQLDEESAQLSALVQRASLRRISIPPHLVALPISGPNSPTSASGVERSLSFSTSIDRQMHLPTRSESATTIVE